MSAPLLPALAAGLAAGYAVAVPLGPMAVLLVQTSARHGRRTGLAAGLGMALVDLCYAAVAAVAGVVAAQTVAGAATPIRLVASGVLCLIAAFGLRSALRPPRHADGVQAGGPPAMSRPGVAFAGFLGLTAVNPLTIAAFGAIVLGLDPGLLAGTTSKVLFVSAAFVASLSWQWGLALAGSALGARLPERARTWTTLAGSLLIFALAAWMGWSALA